MPLPGMAASVETAGPTSHRFVSQRLRLNYVDWGNPQAPPLILQHGGRDHCRSWDRAAERLRHDWHVICPDLAGHGDSAWSPDGDYTMFGYVYDLAQLVATLGYDRVTIVGHSLGGNIATRFAGLYPDTVERLVNIEGLGPSPARRATRDAVPYAERLRGWIAAKHAAAGRQPRRYPGVAAALARMRQKNAYLTEAQAYHLTVHGIGRNEDGSWSWKFDPYTHVWPVADFPQGEIEALWAAVACPLLLFYGGRSFASNPARDGRIAHFRDARVVEYADAGHWLHHDRFPDFIRDVEAFLRSAALDG